MSAFRFLRVCLLVLSAVVVMQIHGFSNLTNNDAYPIYTAEYPFTLLTKNQRAWYRGEIDCYEQERFELSISPFRQSAVLGKDINKKVTQLGDLTGRWNMLALFYPGFDSAGNQVATTAKTDLMNALGITDLEVTTTCNGNLFLPSFTDTNQEFGFFSVPIKYRKYGVRFELDVQLFGNWGLKIQTGACDLIQTGTFTDLTCQAIGPQCATATDTFGLKSVNATGCNIDQYLIKCDCKRLVMQKIMDQKDIIAKTLGVSLANYNTRSAEDTRIALYWRRVCPVNENREGWPYFLCMPFITIEGTIPTGKINNLNALFSLPTGNDGHPGVGFGAGLNLEFVESIEIGFNASMTAFGSKNYCDVPVPTNELQAGMYPYKADLCRKPGTNWNFGLIMHAHHFLDRLSMYAQYQVVTHGVDTFSNVTVKPFNSADTATPPVALVNKMSNESRWHAHVFNLGFTYDISPNIALGFLWQGPLSQRNAYRATTLLGSVLVTW